MRKIFFDVLDLFVMNGLFILNGLLTNRRLQHSWCELHDVREDRFPSEPAGQAVQGALRYHGVTVAILFLQQSFQNVMLLPIICNITIYNALINFLLFAPSLSITPTTLPRTCELTHMDSTARRTRIAV